MFGPKQDVPGECNAHLYIGDDYGDNSATIRCALPEGHEGEHKETFSRGGKPVVITWHVDEKDTEEIDPYDIGGCVFDTLTGSLGACINAVWIPPRNSFSVVLVHDIYTEGKDMDVAEFKTFAKGISNSLIFEKIEMGLSDEAVREVRNYLNLVLDKYESVSKE